MLLQTTENSYVEPLQVSALFSQMVCFKPLPQVRDERDLVGLEGASLDCSDAASVLGGGEELDLFLRAALVSRGGEEGDQRD